MIKKFLIPIFGLAIVLAALSSCGGGGGGGGGGGDCGGLEGKACDAGKFCHFTDLSCGAADSQGSCEDIPLTCDSVVTTVCSCEGLTFFNECYANAASQSVSGPGQCP